MLICDWCGEERAHGNIVMKDFPSNPDTSFVICWTCLAKFKALVKICGGGNKIPPQPPEDSQGPQS